MKKNFVPNAKKIDDLNFKNMQEILLKNATEKQILEEIMKRQGISFTSSEDPNDYSYRLMLVDKKTLSALKHGGQLKVKYDKQ